MDEIEKLFQQSDFSSESIGLETRIWNRITNFKEANMPIDKSKLTKEMIDRAAMCQTADELIALAKIKGIEITKEEAEAYLDELEDFELTSEALENVAGGGAKARLFGCSGVY
jgi:predicted DNA-binding protein